MERVIKSGNYLVSLLITDNKTTICAKAFVSENKWKEIDELLKPGDGVKLRGEVQWDTFENMNTVMYTDLEKTDREIGREDTWENGRRVELHIHSKMSQMDGFNEAKDIVAMAAKWGQPAVAVTDHGVVQAFPDCAAEAKKQGEKGREIKVIYGLEGYVFDDADCVQEDGSIDYKSKPTHHIIILAKIAGGTEEHLQAGFLFPPGLLLQKTALAVVGHRSEPRRTDHRLSMQRRRSVFFDGQTRDLSEADAY